MLVEDFLLTSVDDPVSTIRVDQEQMRVKHDAYGTITVVFGQFVRKRWNGPVWMSSGSRLCERIHDLLLA